jgi:probable addiction module antidote protein
MTRKTRKGLPMFDNGGAGKETLRQEVDALSSIGYRTNMRLKNYKEDLLKRLEDPHYAAEYLGQVLAEKDGAAFLIALKDVVEAGGGMGSLAGRVGLKRPSLYKILSKKGNPTLATLQEILKPLGLRVSVALDKAA